MCANIILQASILQADFRVRLKVQFLIHIFDSFETKYLTKKLIIDRIKNE